MYTHRCTLRAQRFTTARSLQPRCSSSFVALEMATATSHLCARSSAAAPLRGALLDGGQDVGQGFLSRRTTYHHIRAGTRTRRRVDRHIQTYKHEQSLSYIMQYTRRDLETVLICHMAQTYYYQRAPLPSCVSLAICLPPSKHGQLQDHGVHIKYAICSPITLIIQIT